MRLNKDKRTDKEKEIDDFLASFGAPEDELNTDINSYLSDASKSDKPEDAFLRKFDVLQNVENKEEPEPFIEEKPSKVYSKDIFEPNNDNEPKFNASETLTNINEDITKIKTKIKSIDKKDIRHKLFLKENPNFDPQQGSTYFKNGKKVNNKQFIVSKKKLLRDAIGLVAIFVLCFFLYALGCIIVGPKFDFHDVYAYVEQSSVIYDDQGKAVDQVYYTQNRKITKYKDMPEELINSFVALEDKTFWKHHGFNWIRMAGAVVSSVTGGGRISGTSTITQQLARNVYLADIKSVRSIKRKVLEMYYASRIETCMEKEDIIEAYLNTIYLGYGCYGVDAAAKAYFSKNVKDLSLLECASLAALPQAPDEYALIKCVDSSTVTEGDTNIIMREPDTYIANDTAKDRRNICLDLLREQGYITESKYKKCYDKDLIDFINPTVNSGNGKYSYYHEYLVDTVINDLVEQCNMTEEDAERAVYTKGLKIYSTMDSKAQKTIVKEFADSYNFPYLSGAYNTDSEGNIISDEGVLLLYKYSNFFDDNGNFTFTKKEAKVNEDGSITIYRGNRLNIYTTESNGLTDYSLEFKQTYVNENDTVYAIPGGYINVPTDYKSLDSNDNLVISAQFFTDYPDSFNIKKNKITLTNNGYSLPQKTIQPQAAMVIVGVGTGEVKAMVGGRDTKGERLLNRALNPRQPGSSIKPIGVYGAALQKSYDLSKKNKKWQYTDFKIDKQGTKGYGDYITTHSSVADEKTIVNGKTWPVNSNNAYTGKKNFMTAIQQSTNTCAVKIQLQVGTDYSAKMIEKFGITTLITDTSAKVNDMNPAALALGGMSEGVKPLEMALAYAAFPGEGKINTPVCYTKVCDRNGEVLLTSKSEQKEAMNSSVAWIMTKVLQSVVTNGIAGSAYVDNVQSGGKTGTTQTQCDIWFDGFTPTYAAALWIGSDNNVPMSSMSGPAAALWGKIMRQIPYACSGSYKPQPADVIQKNGFYFTLGTENGLTSYSPTDEKKMQAEAKARAYDEWLKERENHKIEVIDSEADPGEYEMIDVEVIIGYEDVIDPETGEVTEEPIYETRQKKHWIRKPTPRIVHYEYEKGWRDGDFKWDGVIPDDLKKKYNFDE